MESASREETAPAAGAPGGARLRTSWIARHGALVCFAAAVVIAVPLLLFWGRNAWFTQDDWDFLSSRTIGSADDLFRAHFQHWTTLPILPYRFLWTVVGIRSYAPYQALIVVMHLTAAALLLAVMRRAGVRPWLATVVGVVFIYFGAGAENILVAFQITFVGSLVFGLTQLLLADHEGPLDRRDWLGLAAGLSGLMCSGVAITMTVVVGIAILLRRGLRGWRVAAFHTVPLAVIYLVWLQFAPKGQRAGNYRSESPGQVLHFVWIGFEAAFARLGQVPGIGLALALILIGGLAVLFRTRGMQFPLGRLAVPLAMLAGGLVFLLVTGVARAGQPGLLKLVNSAGPERARDSRYVYLTAAMLLPALALASDALIRRWKLMTIPVLALLLIGMPGNLRSLARPLSLPPFANARATRQQILALPRLPLADQLRHSHIAVPIQYPRFAAEGLTYGWLVGGVESGRIPAPGPRNKFQDPTDVLKYFLVPSPVRGSLSCDAAPKVSIHVLEKGQQLTIERGNVYVRYAPIEGAQSFRILVKPSTLAALVGPLRLRIVPQGEGVVLCK